MKVVVYFRDNCLLVSFFCFLFKWWRYNTLSFLTVILLQMILLIQLGNTWVIMQYQFCGISVAFLAKLAKQRHSPACTAGRSLIRFLRSRHRFEVSEIKSNHVTTFQIEDWVLRREENHSTRQIPLGAECRNNQFNPHITSSLGIEPGPNWWKASALTTAPSLLVQTPFSF